MPQKWRYEKLQLATRTATDIAPYQAGVGVWIDLHLARRQTIGCNRYLGFERVCSGACETLQEDRLIAPSMDPPLALTPFTV